MSPSSILTIAYNLFRQFFNVTFNEIFCILAFFLFYGTPAEYIASGNSWWLLWPKCWLETEFDFRFRLRFSQFNQVNQTNCEKLVFTRVLCHGVYFCVFIKKHQISHFLFTILHFWLFFKIHVFFIHLNLKLSIVKL